MKKSILKALAFTISLSACGKIVEPAKTPQADMLELLRNRYAENLSKLQGWPSRTDCDATLWAGIAKKGGVTLDITESKETTGQWYRRPTKDCFDTASSRSDFSNDMAVGVILSASDADIKHWFSWVKDKNYKMGRGEIGATLMKPNVLGVLGRRLGKNLAPRLPYAANDKDYVRHIQSLMIYIDGLSTGYLKSEEIQLLAKYNDGKDYLIAAIIAKYHGNHDSVIKLLLKEGKPPSYVRGDQPERYRLAHWLLSASIVLGE